MSTEAAKRIVPGAPPPTSVSKSQKKKRRAAKKEDDAPEVSLPDTQAAALTEKAPTEEDVKGSVVAEELVASKEKEPVQEQQQPDPASVKPSLVVDHLNKRLKQLHKKIVSLNLFQDYLWSFSVFLVTL